MSNAIFDAGRSDDELRIRQALTDLQELILASYPTSAFAITRGEDPPGVYLTATVDVEELDDVRASFIDRLVDIQFDEGLPVYLVLEKPVEREVTAVRALSDPRSAALSSSVE